MGCYILGPDHELISCSDVQKWGFWLQNADRIVAQTGYREAKSADWRDSVHPGVFVSTVFLGFDHRIWGDGPPDVFETMVFGGPLDQKKERYGSWKAAEAGHQRWVAKAFPALAKISPQGSSSGK
jgi:hypothetical protein